MVVVHGRNQRYVSAQITYLLRVGNEGDTLQNPPCTANFLPDLRQGTEVQCNLQGQFITLWQTANTNLIIYGIVAFLDCNDPAIWEDPINLDPLIASLDLGETINWKIPLLLKMESVFGVEICGQRVALVSSLPSFCTLSELDLTCAPLADADRGTYEIEIVQIALEHS